MEAKEKDDESLLIEELNGISSGKINLSVIQDRKDLLDSIVNSLVTAKVLDGAPQSGLTDTFRDIWAQLRTLQSHEDAKELLATITSLHDDLSLLDAASKSFLAPAEDAKQSPAAPVHAKRADERDVLSLVETMHGKCRRIVEQAGRCWESDQGRLENSKKYFDTDRIAKVVQGLENILNSIVQNALENIKWPMQKYALFSATTT